MRSNSSNKQPRLLVSSAKDYKNPEYVDSRTLLERAANRQTHEPLAFNSNLEKFRTPPSKKVTQNRVLRPAEAEYSPYRKAGSPDNERKFNDMFSTSQKELQITRGTLIEQQGKYEKLIKDQKFHIHELEMENLRLTKENLSLRSGLRKDLDCLQEKDNKIIMEMQKKCRDAEEQNKHYVQENIKLKQNYDKEIQHLRSLLKESDNKAEIYKREFNSVHNRSRKDTDELGFKEEFIRKLQESIKDKSKSVFELKLSNDQYLKFLEEKEQKIQDLEKSIMKEKQVNKLLSDRLGKIAVEYSPERIGQNLKGRLSDQKSKNSKYLRVDEESYDFEGSLEKSLKKARVSLIATSGEDALIKLKQQILDLESKISDLASENLQIKRENTVLQDKNRSLDEDIKSYRSFIARAKGKDQGYRPKVEIDEQKKETEAKLAQIVKEKEKIEKFLKDSEQSNKVLREKTEGAERKIIRVERFFKDLLGREMSDKDLANFEDIFIAIKEKFEKIEEEAVVLKEQVPGLLEENNTLYLQLKKANEQLKELPAISKDYKVLKESEKICLEIRSQLGFTENSELSLEDFTDLNIEIANLLKKSKESEDQIQELYSLVQEKKKQADLIEQLEDQIKFLTTKLEKKMLKNEKIKVESQSLERKLGRTEESMQSKIEEIKAEARENKLQLEENMQKAVEKVKSELSQAKIQAEEALRKQFDLEIQHLESEISSLNLLSGSLEVEVNEKKQEIAYLKTQIVEAEKEMQDLKAENEEKIARLEGKIKEFHETREVKSGQEVDLRGILDEKCKENERLIRKIQNKKENKAKLRQEFMDSKEQNRIYEESLTEISEKLQNAESEIKKYEDNSKKLETDLSVLQQERNELKDQLSGFQNISEPSILIEDSQEILKKNYEDRESALLSTISGLKEQLDAVNLEKIELNLQFCSINTADLSVLKKKIEDIKHEKAELSSILNQKGSEWQERLEQHNKIEKKQASEIQNLEQKMQILLDSLDKDQVKLASLQAELDKTAEEKENAANSLDSLLKQHEESKKQVNQLNEDNVNLQNLIMSLKNANHILSVDMSKLESSLQKEKLEQGVRSEQILNLKAEKENLLLELINAENKIKKLEADHAEEMREIKEEHAKELLCIQTYQEEPIEVFNNPNNLNSIEALQGKLEETKALLAQATAGNDLLTQQVADLMKENKKNSAIIQDLTEQNTKIMTEYQDVLKKIKALEQENVDLNKLVDDENMMSIEDSLTANDSIRMELEAKDSELKSLKDTTDKKDQELKSLKEILAEKIAECEQNLELRKSLTKTNLEIKDKESKIKLLEMQKKKLVTEVQDLQDDLKNLRDENFLNARNGEVLEEVEKERDFYKEKLEDSQNEARVLAGLKEKSEYFEENFRKVKVELERIEKECKEKSKECEELQQINNKLHEEIGQSSELKEKLGKIAGELKEKENRLKIVEAQLKKTSNDKQDLQEHLKVVQEENYQLIINLEKLEDEQKIDELIERIHKLEQTEKDLRNKILLEKEKSLESQEEKKKIIEKNSELEEKLNKTVEEFRVLGENVSNDYWKEEKVALERELQEANNKNKIAQEKVAELRKDARGLESKLGDFEGVLNEKEEKIRELEEELKKLRVNREGESEQSIKSPDSQITVQDQGVKSEELAKQVKAKEFQLKILKVQKKKLEEELLSSQIDAKQLREENFSLYQKLNEQVDDSCEH